MIPVSLGAAELFVDHVTAAGKDLKVMQASLAAIGLASEYGGPHSNHATEMAVVSFADGSYLELIAIQPHADPQAVAAHDWGRQMEANAGPCAWAVRVKDMAAEINRLQGTGLSVSAPQRSGRARPDGIRLDWETAQVGQEPRGSFFPFLIRDLTPRQQRAFPKGRPSAKDFSGVRRVVIAVRDLGGAVKRYQAAYGLPAPDKQVDAVLGAQLALMGGSPVALAAPLKPDSWLGRRLEQFGEGPCAFILRATKAPSTTRWFDSGKLGWYLGFEATR
jgi:hypothetical protein